MDKKILILIALVSLLAISLFSITWYLTPNKASESSLVEAYANRNIKIEEQRDTISIEPENPLADSAILFYGGGLVEEEAYLLFLSRLSEQSNQKIFIPKFWLNLAVTDPLKGVAIIEENPEITNWSIIGHSLGGAMSCRVVNNQPEITTLILLASYCDIPITNTNLITLQIFGSNDLILNKESLTEFSSNLPEDKTTTIEIEGMNHAQFGNYNPGEDDGEAEISNREAQTQVIELILNLE